MDTSFFLRVCYVHEIRRWVMRFPRAFNTRWKYVYSWRENLSLWFGRFTDNFMLCYSCPFCAILLYAESLEILTIILTENLQLFFFIDLKWWNLTIEIGVKIVGWPKDYLFLLSTIKKKKESVYYVSINRNELVSGSVIESKVWQRSILSLIKIFTCIQILNLTWIELSLNNFV